MIDDLPGLVVVMRTVAMLVNEAADALQAGIAGATAIDIAMRLGVNYPHGPLAWADGDRPQGTSPRPRDHLAAHYGEDRYRASPLALRRRSWPRDRFDVS